MALTGLALTGFVVTHLAGNLLLYLPQGSAFNVYAHKLESMGPLLYVAEAGLALFFLLHIAMAIWTRSTDRAARPIGYQVQATKGGPSKSTAASRNMIVTGVVLLVFVVLHIKHFKFGPGIEQGYVTDLGGAQARDLHRWVTESFRNGWVTLSYVGVMILLGAHLRHGFWSAFQSLGVLAPAHSQKIHCLAALIATVLAVGFLGIPIWIYFGMGGLFQ